MFGIVFLELSIFSSPWNSWLALYQIYSLLRGNTCLFNMSSEKIFCISWANFMTTPNRHPTSWQLLIGTQQGLRTTFALQKQCLETQRSLKVRDKLGNGCHHWKRSIQDYVHFCVFLLFPFIDNILNLLSAFGSILAFWHTHTKEVYG